MLLRCQTVRVAAKQPMAFALAEIHRAVAAFLDGAEVRHVALEQTIYVQNFQTAQILGAARGAAIAAAALHARPVFEYAPLRVKQAVVGAGRASKEQMARTVMALLGHGRHARARRGRCRRRGAVPCVHLAGVSDYSARNSSPISWRD